ncbi:nucleotidyltransferase domain-containing protein [Flavitalea antarctica]
MCVKKEILATLSYFDLFSYPLTPIEIVKFLSIDCSVQEIALPLLELEQEGSIFKLDDFYALHNNPALATRRKNGNIKARQQLVTADKIASFLAGFPFVSGVAVSGSLSKNFADENSDIDFFIITKSNRLWLARTFMHLFKKLTFLVGKQHYFCMNYYIDHEMLRIKEQNVYTAIEVATLMPLRGIETFGLFFQHNKWVSQYLPNHNMHITYVKANKDSLVKKFIEFFFNNAAGNYLDTLLMKITANKWAEKTRRKKLNKNGNVMGMDAGKHYAKPLPANFQVKLLERYEIRLYALYRQFEEQSGSNILNI